MYADVTTKDLVGPNAMSELFSNLPCLPGMRSPRRLCRLWWFNLCEPVRFTSPKEADSEPHTEHEGMPLVPLGNRSQQHEEV